MQELMGRTLGHYRIVDKIGEGGMGEVYRAHDERLDRDVAVKVLPEEVAGDQDRLRRFEREAKAVAALSHPNILEIFDFDTEGDVTYAVTELLEGETLREHLQKLGGPLPWKEVQEIGTAVADGLGAAHGKGVVHRDIKPSNIFLCSDERVKILDFGLAATHGVVDGEAETGSIEAPLTREGSVMGTVGYMAPEQVRGEPADPRTDIFALGCVLYEMLTGHRAFKRDTTAEIMTAILREEPPSFAESGAQVPPDLAKTVSHCLEKNPERRFQSAADIAFALGSLSGTSAPVAPLSAESTTASRRWPLVAATLMSLSVVLAVLLWMKPTGADLSNYRFSPFATDAQGETAGAWSPDGRSIAYVKRVQNRWQVIVRSLDADSPVQITDLPRGAWAPFWAPDGRRVWFLSNQEVWSVGLAGGEPELARESPVMAAALSPDGKTLASWRVTADNGQYGSVWLASPPTAEPRKYEPAPFEVKAVLNPVVLRFSPDGAQILASFPSTEGVEMWLLPFPDGPEARGAPRQILSDFRWTITPAISWMPDSRHVVMSFRETPASRPKLWTADVRAQTLRPLTAGGTEEAMPDVSPDGSKIVFTSGGLDFDTIEVPLDGSPSRDLLATSRDEHSAAWAPGENRFVYMTDRSGQVEIRVRSRLEDWDRPVVTQEDFPDDVTRILRGPVVSPDGEQVAYDRQPENGQPAIWLSPITGGTPTKLVETTGGQYAPEWSPDGKWVTFLWRDGGVTKLVKSRVGASEPPLTLVEDCIHPGRIPAWSPTGEWIVYWCNEEPEDGLKFVTPDGQHSRKLAKVGTPAGWVWSRDGATVYTIKTQPGNPQLLAVDVRTGSVATIRDFGSDMRFADPYRPGSRFTLAPDGRSFSATVVRTRMDLWLLEGFNPRRSFLDWFR